MNLHREGALESVIGGALIVILLPLSLTLWALWMLFKGVRWCYKMAKIPKTYTVHASITPQGVVERTNVLTRRVFSKINDIYHDHEKVRWLVAETTGGVGVGVIDLWNCAMIDDFPYVSPTFMPETFTTVDQAVGFVLLNI